MEKINQAIEKISQLSILQVVLISVLVVGLYYALVLQYDDSLYTTEQNITLTRDTIEQKEKEFEDLKVLIERSANLQDEYYEKTKSFNVFVGYMKQIENPTTFFSQMTNSFISTIGIQVNKYESKKAVVVKNSVDQSISSYKFMPLEISIEGTFAQLLSFMSYLTRSKQLISMEFFKIERVKTDQARGQLSLLSLKGEIALYSLFSEGEKQQLQKEMEENSKANNTTTPDTGSVPASSAGVNQ